MLNWTDTIAVVRFPARALTEPSSAPTAGFFPRVKLVVRDALVRAVDALVAWQVRARQRHHLAGLNDHLLKDIGLNRVDVLRETSKPFWRP